MDKHEFLDALAENQQLFDQDIEALFALSKDNDSEIRARVAECLVFAKKDNRITNILINLCKDKDILVRANACDTMGNFADSNIKKCLLSIINNRNERILVKKFALLSYADICVQERKKDGKSLFMEQMHTSRSIPLQVACLYGLYMLGERGRINDLLALINASDYRNRIFVVNTLLDLSLHSNKMNRQTICAYFEERLRFETVESVRETLLSGIRQLNLS